MAALSIRNAAGLAAVLVLTMGACVAMAPGVPISTQCGQASAKKAPIDLPAAINEFVQSIPESDSSGYTDPKTDPEGVRTLIEGFVQVTRGDLVAACQALTPLAYDVILTTDSTTGRDLVLLREMRKERGFARAWGLYLVSWPPAGNPSTLAVEAPHACPHTVRCDAGDRLTHLVAVAVFQEANARYLFINGADRRANGQFDPRACEQDSRCADVAHQPESPFEKIHEKAVADLGPGVKIYQSHRFLSSKHLDLRDNVLPGTGGTANVVVSTGNTPPSGLAGDVAVGIEAAGTSFFHVCLFKARAACPRLSATENVQKDTTPEGRFVHVEASDEVVLESCEAPCRRNELAKAIAEVMK